MKASEVGEFGLIDRLASSLVEEHHIEAVERLIVGIGDDAAVWRDNGSAVVATTDTLVAGVHFLPGRTPWRDLGWKALAVNVSDIAAMGGTPEFAIVTLALADDQDVEELEELYEGLAAAGAAFGVAIAGGDIVRSPTFSVTVGLCGRAQVVDGDVRVMRRDGAMAGDLVAVTGELGGAAGGLRVLQDRLETDKGAAALVQRHLRPQPRLGSAQAGIGAGIRCAIDVSDGLLQDLGHICRYSRLGAVVWRDKVPVQLGLAPFFGPEEALRMAVSGGEDYELLLVGPQEKIEAAAHDADAALTVIGEMVIQGIHSAELLDERGGEIELGSKGWDHLREQA
jgi:thiamine-monophosphate kinase